MIVESTNQALIESIDSLNHLKTGLLSHQLRQSANPVNDVLIKNDAEFSHTILCDRMNPLDPLQRYETLPYANTMTHFDQSRSNQKINFIPDFRGANNYLSHTDDGMINMSLANHYVHDSHNNGDSSKIQMHSLLEKYITSNNS